MSVHLNSEHPLESTHDSITDPINPPYYNGRDVMDIINRYALSFPMGQVIKYSLREKGKGGLEDLKKAKWYLEEEIRLREELLKEGAINPKGNSPY